MTSPRRSKPGAKSSTSEPPSRTSGRPARDSKPGQAAPSGAAEARATDQAALNPGATSQQAKREPAQQSERARPSDRKSEPASKAAHRSEPAAPAGRQSEPTQKHQLAPKAEPGRESAPKSARPSEPAAQGGRKGERKRAQAGAAARSKSEPPRSEGRTVKPPRAGQLHGEARAGATKRAGAPQKQVQVPKQAANAASGAAELSAPAAKISIPHSPIVANGVARVGDGGPTLVPPARRARDLRKAAAAHSDALEVSDEPIWSDEAQGAEPVLGSRSPSHGELANDAPDDAAAAFRLTRGSGGDRLREAAAFGSAQSLLSTDYYFRQYGAHGMRSLSAEVDDFGFDPHVDEKARPLLEGLCKRYFRVEVVGAEHIPQHGRALLVANRSGALPWDGLVLRTALRANRPELPAVRWLSEDSVIHYPFMGIFMNRLGAVRACPENAERLLVQNPLVAVFPEGAQGSRKLFRDRYRLQRFGRGGYVKLALKFGVPILPTAIIGGEETNPVLGRSRFLGRFFGSESVPLTPTFPWLGPAGLLPAPVKWRIVIGEPIDLSAHGVASADDALVVHRLNEQVRASLQALVDHGKRTRGGAFFG